MDKFDDVPRYPGVHLKKALDELSKELTKKIEARIDSDILLGSMSEKEAKDLQKSEKNIEKKTALNSITIDVDFDTTDLDREIDSMLLKLDRIERSLKELPGLVNVESARFIGDVARSAKRVEDDLQKAREALDAEVAIRKKLSTSDMDGSDFQSTPLSDIYHMDFELNRLLAEIGRFAAIDEKTYYEVIEPDNGGMPFIRRQTVNPYSSSPLKFLFQITEELNLLSKELERLNPTDITTEYRLIDGDRIGCDKSAYIRKNMRRIERPKEMDKNAFAQYCRECGVKPSMLSSEQCDEHTDCVKIKLPLSGNPWTIDTVPIISLKQEKVAYVKATFSEDDDERKDRENRLYDYLKSVEKPSHRDYRIFAVDFDGCLVSNAWPEIGRPNLTLINALKRCQADGDKVILWTNREGDDKWKAITHMINEHNFYFNSWNSNCTSEIKQFGNDCRKVGADLYIDDKALNITMI